MTYLTGTDVIIEFMDDHIPGVVISHLRGWVLATVAIDPLYDYGALSARLDPHSTVCVKERFVRSAETGRGCTENSGSTQKQSESA